MFRFYSLSSESNFTLTCPGIAIDRQEYSFKMANILNMCFIEKYPMFRGMTETEIFFFDGFSPSIRREGPFNVEQGANFSRRGSRCRSRTHS